MISSSAVGDAVYISEHQMRHTSFCRLVVQPMTTTANQQAGGCGS